MTRALAEPNFDEFSRAGGPTLDMTTMTSYRKEWPYPVAFPERAAEDDPGRDDRRVRRAPAPRRRDREVRPRHLLLQRRARGASRRAKSRRLVESPRDVPTYDHKPEMSAAAAADAFVEHWARGRLPLRRHQLRQPRHGRPHRRDPGGGEGGRDGRRPARPRGRGGRTARAAPASSPPTTATATTCSSPTARPTPPTR